MTGATPLVDVQNVRTQNLIERETLDTLPTGKSVPAYVALTLGAQLVGSGQDVGGNRGEAASSVMYHGGRNRDQRLAVEGMNINIASQEGGGWGNMVKVSQANVEEISIQTSGQNAEVETSGALVNIVPKEGGNSFSGNLTLAYTNGDLQGDNLDDKLLARGVRNTSEVRKVYDYAGNLGGPIKRDEDRLTQLDLRLTKIFTVGGVRSRGNFDAYNVLNGNSVLSVLSRLGPADGGLRGGA